MSRHAFLHSVLCKERKKKSVTCYVLPHPHPHSYTTKMTSNAKSTLFSTPAAIPLNKLLQVESLELMSGLTETNAPHFGLQSALTAPSYTNTYI